MIFQRSSYVIAIAAGLSLSSSIIGLMAATPAQAGGAYGPDTCRQGYVWREAFPGDHVCVTPKTRSQAAYDNSQAPYRRNPGGGAYGPDTCRQGYVWREAFSGDHVCVTPQTRSQTAYDNSQAPYRFENSSVPIDHGSALNPVHE